MRGDVQELGLRPFEPRDAVGEGHTVQAGGDAYRVALESCDLVLAEDRGERARQDDHHAPSLLQVERDEQRRPVVRRHRGGERRLLGGDAAAGQDRSVRLRDEGGGAAHQAGGPVEGAPRQRRPVRAVQQEIVHRPPDLILLRLAPEPPQPGRRREAHVKERHHHQHHDVNGDGEVRAAALRAPEGRDQDDRDQACVAKAQRPQPGALDGRPPDGGEAEPEYGLRHADDPRHHHRRQGDQLGGRVCRVRIRGQAGCDRTHGDCSDADADDPAR